MSRMRQWLGRTKAAPARIDALHAEGEEMRARLAETAASLARIEAEIQDLRSNVAGPGGVADLNESAERLEQLLRDEGEELHRLDATVREEGALTRVAGAGQRRDEAAERLIKEHGHDGPLTPGLSIITITWNHAGFLEESVASSLTILDAQPRNLQGEVLVLDDCSTDETPELLARLTHSDSRVRVIRSPLNLTLSRARNVLLQVCATSHAFVLDADNVGFPDGVDALYSVAREWESAFAYGNVIKARPDGSEFIPASNEPPTAALSIGNYIDSMAVVDVAVLRKLGGYTLDPLLHSYDDYELVTRLGRLGELLAFVPTVVGRYRILDTSYIGMTGDSRVPLRRLERAYRSDGGASPDDMAVLAAHPATGPVWATPAAMAMRPALIEMLADVDTTPEGVAGSRVLVVSSGGFRNAGDDAMATAVIQRILQCVPRARIDLVTDGDLRHDDSGTLVDHAVWAGTLSDVVAGLDPNAVRSGCPDESLADKIVEVSGIGTSDSPSIDLSGYSLVVISGGGFLNSVWVDHAVRRSALAAAAGVVGVPVVCTGQGVGPFAEGEDDLDLRVVGYLIARSRVFALRDPESADLLRRHDLTPDHVTVVGDDASAFPPADADEVERSLRVVGLEPADSFVAVHIRQAGYVGLDDAAVEAFAALVDEVAWGRDAAVLGITTSETPPLAEAISLARMGHGATARNAAWRVLECHHDPGLLAAVLGRANAALVHSYHAALFAVEQRTPTLLFVSSDYYRHKAEGLRRLAALPEEFTVDINDAVDRSEIERRLEIVGSALERRPSVVDASTADAFYREAFSSALDMTTSTARTRS